MAEAVKKRPRPVPVPTNITRPFWDAAKEGKLVLQRCRRCGTWQYWPRPVCMRCISRDLEWKEAAGRGVVYSFTITRLPAEGFEGREPYVLASVDLPEGTRMMAHLLNCPIERVRIGLPVRVVWEKVTDEISLPQFEPDA
jgi:uncharacterized OB-fold protein